MPLFPCSGRVLELVPIFFLTSWLFCQVPSSLQFSQAGSAKDSAHCGFLPGISNRLGGRDGQCLPLFSAPLAGAG